MYTTFQRPTMPGTGLKVCGCGVVVCKPILVFSLGQAEQYGRIVNQNELLFSLN